MKRRQFLGASLAAAGAMILPGACSSRSAGSKKTFLGVGQKNGRWWLRNPEGEHIFSIGLNHIDPSAIRYLASQGIWEEKYDNSMEQWLPKVKSDLTEWAFNCLGWEQEVVIIDPQQANKLLGKVVYGQDYGPFIQHASRQLPGLAPTLKKPDRRLSEILEESQGQRRPTWYQ